MQRRWLNRKHCEEKEKCSLVHLVHAVDPPHFVLTDLKYFHLLFWNIFNTSKKIWDSKAFLPELWLKIRRL